MKESNLQNTKMSGGLLAATAYLLWGALTLYWMLLDHVPPFAVVAFRVLFSMVFLSTVLLFKSQRDEMKLVFTNKKLLLKFIASSIFIFINWALFIWGISMGWHLDVSFGYFLTPLMQVILGAVFLKEKMDTGTTVSFLLALAAIVYMMIAQGVFPWFSIAISLFFALYGLVKKTVKTGAFAGLYIETLFMTPASAAILVFTSQTAPIPFGTDFLTTFLLIAAGIVTTVPLVLYNLAAKKISLIALGFYQYLSPTGTLLIGIFVLHNNVDASQYIGFALIWLALIIYTVASVVKKRKEKQLQCEA